MTQPPLTKSRFASLWGGPRNPEAEKAASELRAKHEAEEKAGRHPRDTAPSGEPVDAYGQVSALDTEDEDADGNPVKPPAYTVRVPGYGGFIVQRADDPTSAMLGVLLLCEANLAKWDPVLTRFGVLVARLDTQPAVSFYVRRTRDGMTLAIPDARTRPEALMQLTQALLELQAKYRETFERGGVQAFRNG